MQQGVVVGGTMLHNFRRFFSFGLFLALFWTLSGCSDGDKVLHAEDHGRTIELRAGAALEIVLPGNPTTGYHWEIAKVNSRILGLMGEIEYLSVSDKAGAGGEFVLHFEALSPGRTDLLLIYQRPFEVDREPENVFEITVNVNG
jgi:predicted secreted protein